ncbi:hypothetical protein IPZ58_23330 [Streptomyces roseoverticillatus]|uniref:hypothetical protein n=1 Tax=Streptomyces roseoverticillatus TaxID=66429 RepID=UPI001F25DD7F|nr:hypothetical protein [Streptomyces roseoverticillatus]MCF3104503.1 hypothetical protein [Streptomyces roseoverticillatus]
MTALRHRLYRRLHPRRYRAGQLAEQRHQFLDLDPHLVRGDYTRPARPSPVDVERGAAGRAGSSGGAR